MSAKVSAKAVSQVENQIPQFISEENPLYEKFLKNYYEFLETLCVKYTAVGVFTTLFTNGETVTGQTSGATANVKGKNSKSSTLKLFLEPTNDLNFLIDEVMIGGTSNSRGTIYHLDRNPLNGTKTFKDLTNSDLTSDGILDWFKKELYPNIRNTATVDLRYFLKHLKEFYRSKGSEKSYRTLFRALYGQDSLDFYYPKTDMFKISDGNWLQDTVLQLSNDSTYLNFNGLTITGNTSSATAFVSNVTTRKVGTVPIVELVVTTFVGAFAIGETITATTATGVELSAILTGMLTDVIIVKGGEGYSIDEALTITDSTNVGFGAAAKVKTTTGDQVAIITVSTAGDGYQVNDPVTFNNAGTNAVVTAGAKIASLSNTFTVDVVTTLLEAGIETKKFDLAGDFGTAVSVGYLIGNTALYANSTKKGVVTAYAAGSPNAITIYDKDNETLSGVSTVPENLTAWANNDIVYLFDKNGVAVLGAFSVTINDASFDTISAHVALNSTNFGSGFASPDGTFTTSGTTVSITYSSGHNLAVGNPIKLSFSTAAMNGTYNVAAVTSSTVFTITMSGGAASGTVEMIPIRTSRMKNAFVFTTQTFGKVATISYSSHGSGYETTPSISLTSLGYYSTVETRSDGSGGYFGSNATLAVGDLGGAITGVTITEPGFGYSVTPAVIGATHSTPATLTGVRGITRIKEGKYSGESGMPSSQKKIQDNNYYQDYSYVLKTTDSVDVWRTDVLKLLHPAGYKLFGEVLIENLLNTQMFDRGFSNINSADVSGKQTYRDVTFFLFSSIISGLQITAGEAVLDVKTQIDSIIAALEQFAEVLIKGGTSQTYLINPLTASNGLPAEMFSKLFVNNVASVSVGTSTTITTSTAHHLHENDLVSLDEFVGTNVSLINGNMYKATAIGNNPATNTTFVLKEIDETINLVLESSGDNLTMEDGTTTFSFEDRKVDTTGMSISTQGKSYRSSKKASSGIFIDMYSTEYIDIIKSNKIHEYIHNSVADLSTLSVNDAIDISGRHISIESSIIQEDTGDNFLLEDGTTSSPNTSAFGKILSDSGQLDLDGANDAHQLAITPAVQRQISGVTNNIISFSRPIEYRGVPHSQHPHNQGFGLYKHKVDKRVLTSA